MRYRALVFAMAGAAALAAPASAQTTTPLEQRVDELSEEVDELRAEAAQIPPVAGAVERLSEAIAHLENEMETLRLRARAMPQVVDTIDDLEARMRELERELGLLRTQVADLEQPVWGPPRDADVERGDGFVWVTPDDDYALALYGVVQPRYQLDVASGFDEVLGQTFDLRRARLGVHGYLSGPSLRYLLAMDFRDERPLLEGYLDYEVADALLLRAGQSKVPFTRAYLTSGSRMAFAERPLAADALRYDRDLGASARGRFFDERVGYAAGLANGTGRNEPNLGQDFAGYLRLDGAILGDEFDYLTADVAAERSATLLVGGGLVQETTAIPDEVGGIPVSVTDVDADGDRDAIRVTSASVDAAFSHSGLDVTLEGLWRREDWGAILDHPENAAVAAWVGGPVEHYFGAYGEATYAVLPGRLVVGGRAGYLDQPLLGLGGRDPAAPAYPDTPPSVGEVFELAAAAQLYRDGDPLLSLDYTRFSYDEPGVEPAHRLILQAQFLL